MVTKTFETIPSADQLLSVEQARELIPVSKAWLAAKRAKGATGGPPFFRIGDRVFYRRGDLLEWVASNTVRQEAA